MDECWWMDLSYPGPDIDWIKEYSIHRYETFNRYYGEGLDRYLMYEFTGVREENCEFWHEGDHLFFNLAGGWIGEIYQIDQIKTYELYQGISRLQFYEITWNIKTRKSLADIEKESQWNPRASQLQHFKLPDYA